MRLPHSLPRIRLIATACTALALTLLPSQGQSQGVMNLLNALGGGGSTTSNTGGGLLGAITGGGAPAGQGDDLISMLTRSVESIDEPREIEIGRQLSAVLLGSKPLHPDMALQRYVNQLGRWISLQSPRPNLPWTFVVLDDPGYNAFAAPGGYVFVTKGLIDRCADEAELAGILAHEITHVTAKHHLLAIRKTAQSGMLTQLVASQIKTRPTPWATWWPRNFWHWDATCMRAAWTRPMSTMPTARAWRWPPVQASTPTDWCRCCSSCVLPRQTTRPSPWHWPRTHQLRRAWSSWSWPWARISMVSPARPP